MMISEEKIREVADRLSIVDLVSDYLQLKKNGSNYLGLCPFHKEKTPSFNVNPARDTFHCFGCGTGGNVFSFIMKIEGVSFPEAVKLAAKRCGVFIEEREYSPSEKIKFSENEKIREITESAASFYRDILKNSDFAIAAREYLSTRNVTAEISEDYRIGFAPDRYDYLLSHLKKRGLDLKLAAKVGLIRENERGEYFDLFRNRLIFPIKNQRGEVIAFAGRVLDSSLPKYINSPESPIYHKSSVLFGIDSAIPAIRSERFAIVVEGYFDHLALYKNGFKNVVATCGTALTSKHAELLKRHADKVYLLFDGDKAGRNAAIKGMEIFLEHKVSSYRINLPDGDDPDTFFLHSTADDFRELVSRAKPSFEAYINSVLEVIKPDSVDNKVKIIDEILPRFKRIADPVEKNLYEAEICRMIGITIHAFRKRGVDKKRGVATEKTSETSEISTETADKTEDMLISILSSYPESIEILRERGGVSLFDGDYQVIASEILNCDEFKNDSVSLQIFADRFDERLKSAFTRIIVSDISLKEDEWKKALEHCINTREKRSLAEIKKIAQLLATTSPDSDMYSELIKRADELRNKKSKI